MKIFKTSINKLGFTDIFISNCTQESKALESLVNRNALAEIMLPEKTPYIVFYLEINAFNFSRKFFNPLIYQLKYLGKTKHEKDKYFAITITGPRKVLAAIEIFKQTEEFNEHHLECEKYTKQLYPYTARDPLLNYLDSLTETCKLLLEQHPRKIPHRSKSIDSFHHLDGTPIDLNNLSEYVKKKDQNPDKFQFNTTLPIIEKKTKTKYLLKMHSGRRTLSDFEVAHGLLERMLLNECHPDVYLVHGEKGERIGSISEMYPDSNFITIREYIKREYLKRACNRILMLPDYVAIPADNDADKKMIYIKGNNAYWFEGGHLAHHPIHKDLSHLIGPNKIIHRTDRNFEKITSIIGYTFKSIDAELIITSEMIKVLSVFYLERESDPHTDNYAFVTFTDKFDNNKEKTLCVCFDNDRTDMRLVGKYHNTNVDKHIPVDAPFKVKLNIAAFPKLENSHLEFKDYCVNEEDFEDNWEEKVNKDARAEMSKYQIKLKEILLPFLSLTIIGEVCFSSKEKQKTFIESKANNIKEIKNDLLNDPNFQFYFINNMNELFSRCYSEFGIFNQSLSQEESYLEISLGLVIANMEEIQKEMLAILESTNSPLASQARSTFKKLVIPELPQIQVDTSQIPNMPSVANTPNTQPSTPKTPKTPQTPKTPNELNKRKRNSDNQNRQLKRRLIPITVTDPFLQPISVSTSASSSEVPSACLSYRSQLDELDVNVNNDSIGHLDFSTDEQVHSQLYRIPRFDVFLSGVAGVASTAMLPPAHSFSKSSPSENPTSLNYQPQVINTLPNIPFSPVPGGSSNTVAQLQSTNRTFTGIPMRPISLPLIPQNPFPSHIPLGSQPIINNSGPSSCIPVKPVQQQQVPFRFSSSIEIPNTQIKNTDPNLSLVQSALQAQKPIQQSIVNNTYVVTPEQMKRINDFDELCSFAIEQKKTLAEAYKFKINNREAPLYRFIDGLKLEEVGLTYKMERRGRSNIYGIYRQNEALITYYNNEINKGQFIVQNKNASEALINQNNNIIHTDINPTSLPSLVVTNIPVPNVTQNRHTLFHQNTTSSAEGLFNFKQEFRK